MASTAFTNMFLSSPRPDAGILDFDCLQIVPSDFWRRPFLVHDGSFRKLGNCDFYRGFGTLPPFAVTPPSCMSPVMMPARLG